MGARPRCNLLGPTALGFRHRDDVTRDHARCWRGSASTSTSSRRWAPRRPIIARLGEADFNVVLYPEIAGQAASLAAAHVRPAVDADRPDRRRRDARLHRRGRGACRRRSVGRAGDSDVAAALVLALGRLDLSHRQARLHLRRRHPRHRRRPHRVRRTRLQGRRARHLQPRIRPRGPRGRRDATASRR